MKKIFTTLLAATLTVFAGAAQTVQWGDAAAEKAAGKGLRQATAPQVSQRASGARQADILRGTSVSESPLRSGTASLPKRLSGPQKAVTAADMPVNALQLTYSSTRFELATRADVRLVGDSIFLDNFFGWGTTIRAKVDLATGDFTILRQKVYQHSEYGQVDLMACDVEQNVFDPNGTIPGHISAGKVEIGSWVAIIIDGEYKNHAIGYGLHKNSDFVSSNATLTSQVAQIDTSGTVTGTTPETTYLYVEQPGSNQLRIFNLSDTGGKLECYLHSDSTFSIAPQQLMNNSYPADWQQGVYWTGRDIKGSVTDKTLNFGNWAIYTNTGKYYYRRYVSSELTLSAAPSFPPASTGWAGTGTADDPYQIATVGDLLLLSDQVNGADIPAGAKRVNVFEGKYFKQTKAINLKGYMFPPIGGSDDMKRFAGTYDGDNKTISYLTVSTGSKGYAALFGAVDTVGTIKNVVLSSPDVSCDNYYYAGTVAAYSMGRTENCRVTNGKVRGYLIAGGVCGSSGPATGLSFTGTVEAASNVGGVIGNMRFPITKSNATQTTVIGYGGNENYSVGGVVGYMTSSSLGVSYGGYIEDCYFSGTVTMQRYAMFAGGIAGCSTEADIRRCFSIGEILRQLYRRRRHRRRHPGYQARRLLLRRQHGSAGPMDRTPRRLRHQRQDARPPRELRDQELLHRLPLALHVQLFLHALPGLVRHAHLRLGARNHQLPRRRFSAPALQRRGRLHFPGRHDLRHSLGWLQHRRLGVQGGRLPLAQDHRRQLGRQRSQGPDALHRRR